jgi:mRNA interferase RelE/StbE
MTYELAFKTSALKEWKKLGHTIREQFKKKLAEHLENPHVPASALAGATNLYKIKLRQAGYRLVYSVEDRTITVTVIAVGKRDRNEVYDVALSRLKEQPDAP